MLLLLPLLTALSAQAGLATQPQAAPASPASAESSQKAPPPVPSPAASPKAQGPKTPATTLEVVVQDPRGRPVAGALVSIAVGRELLPRMLSARTDAEGRARLDGLSRPPWDVAVQARGLAPKRVERVYPSEKPLVVRLEAGASLAGVVRDGTTREPVAGASVSVWIRTGIAASTGWDPDAGRISTTSDARGRFELEGLGAGSVTLTATAPGRGRVTLPAVRAGSQVELYLQPGATITGLVRDEAGRPVKGAVVRVMAESRGPMPFLPPGERTDARGRFAIGGLEAGTLVVAARAPTLAPAVQPVTLEANGEAAVELTLAEGGYVTGRLVDATAKPTRGGRVRLAAVDGVTLPIFLHDLAQADAGADGRFTLGPLPPGGLLLQARAAGFAERDVETRLAGRPPSADLGDVTLDSGLAVRGFVRDRAGAGIAGASLMGMARGQERPTEATTEEDGAFVLAGLPPGSVEVMVRAPGYASLRQPVSVGGEDVVIVLDAGGTIVGAVVDAKGQPVNGAFVRAEPESDATAMMSAPPMGTADEGGGRFTLRDAKPGRYVLVATATGHAAGNASGVRVTAGGTTDAGTIRLGTGGAVTGTVADAAGEPIPGATVRIESGSPMSTPPATQTDANGAFELSGVPPGRVDVGARHPAYAPARVSGIVVEADATPAEARIVMTRGGRVEGSVRLRSGQPFAGSRVMLSPRAAPRSFGGAPTPTPVADDGSFVVEHLAAGPALLSVLAPVSGMAAFPGPSLQSVLERDVEVREGETSVVDLQAREVLVSGRVTRGGEPVAGTALMFRAQRTGLQSYYGGGPFSSRPQPATGPQPLAGLTRPDGSYELLVFEPGRYSAMQRGADGSGSPLRSGGQPFIEIPDVPAHAVDFTLGGASVAGLVVEEGTETPVPRAFVSFGGKAGNGMGTTDAEGRFRFDVEPGEGRLRTNAEDFAASDKPLTVGEGGVENLRIELSRGLEITGKVVDTAGRPLGETELTARNEGGAAGFARVLPDGSFRLRGLLEGSHTLVAGSERTGFGVEPGVSAGAKGVVVTVRPASRLNVRVVDPAGRPVAKALARIETVGGAPATIPGRAIGSTDASGTVELVCPEGVIGLLANFEKRSGRATVECRSSAPASAEIVMSEAAPPR